MSTFMEQAKIAARMREERLRRVEEAIVTRSSPADVLRNQLEFGARAIASRKWNKLLRALPDLNGVEASLDDWLRDRLDVLTNYSRATVLCLSLISHTRRGVGLLLMLHGGWRGASRELLDSIFPEPQDRDGHWMWASGAFEDIDRACSDGRTQAGMEFTQCASEAMLACMGRMAALALERTPLKLLLGSCPYRLFTVALHEPIVLGVAAKSGWFPLEEGETSKQFWARLRKLGVTEMPNHSGRGR